MPRRPPHFKVFASIQNHRRAIGVFEDDALLAMYVRVGILAIERYADRTGDSCLLSSYDLERVAGCRGVANARRKLGRLVAATRLTLGQEGAGYRLTIPNLAKKQFSRDGNGAETGPPSSSSSTTTTTEEKKEPAAVAAPVFAPGGNGKPKPEKRSRRAKKTPFPDPFPLDLKLRLYSWAPGAGFTEIQVDESVIRVGDWAISNAKLMADWGRAIQGYMRDGWPMRSPAGPAGDVQSRALAIVERDRAAAKERNHAQ